jgi:hypothetical protein
MLKRMLPLYERTLMKQRLPLFARMDGDWGTRSRPFLHRRNPLNLQPIGFIRGLRHWLNLKTATEIDIVKLPRELYCPTALRRRALTSVKIYWTIVYMKIYNTWQSHEPKGQPTTA